MRGRFIAIVWVKYSVRGFQTDCYSMTKMTKKPRNSSTSIVKNGKRELYGSKSSTQNLMPTANFK